MKNGEKHVCFLSDTNLKKLCKTDEKVQKCFKKLCKYDIINLNRNKRYQLESEEVL